MPLQNVQQPQVGLFDGRAGDRVGADVAQPCDLPLREHLTQVGQALGIQRVAEPVGQDRTGLGNVCRVSPTVMEHGLGQPLVGVVLDECIQPGQGCRVGHHGPARVFALQTADQRRGVSHGHQLALLVGQVERGQQRHLGLWHAGAMVLPDQQAVRQPAVAQDGQHLAGVRRTGRTGKGQRQVGIGSHGAGGVRGVDSMNATTARATSSPLSSCRKCPAPRVTAWGWPRAPGTCWCQMRWPPRVTGSRLLNSVRKGFFQVRNTAQACSLRARSGSRGLVGTKPGNSRAARV